MVSPPPSLGELRDAYRFPGFTPSRAVFAVEGAPDARVVRLTRREKKHAAARAAPRTAPGTIAGPAGSAICPAAISSSTSSAAT